MTSQAMPMPAASSVARAIAATRTDTAETKYECEYIHGQGHVATVMLTELQCQLAKIYEQEYQSGREQTIEWLRSQLSYRAATAGRCTYDAKCTIHTDASHMTERPVIRLGQHAGHVSCTPDGCVR